MSLLDGAAWEKEFPQAKHDVGGKFKVGDYVVRTEDGNGVFRENGGVLGKPYKVTLSESVSLGVEGIAYTFAASRFKLYVGNQKADTAPEYTGGSVDYYKVEVKNPTTASEPYMAECNDIIEALGMNYAEGNAFKALWRRAAHRTLGKKKEGAKDDGLYDAEKVAFFGARLVEQSKVEK